MAVEVTVDHDRCVGSTMCVQAEPEVFGLDEQRQSQVLDPSAAPDDAVVDAAAECPMEAITVVDASSGEQLFP